MSFLNLRWAYVYVKFINGPLGDAAPWVLIRKEFQDFQWSGDREKQEADVWGPGSEKEETLGKWATNVKFERLVKDMNDFFSWYDEAAGDNPTPFLMEIKPDTFSQETPVVRFEIQINTAPSVGVDDERRAKQSIDNKFTSAGFRLFDVDVRGAGDESALTPFRTLYINA